MRHQMLYDKKCVPEELILPVEQVLELPNFFTGETPNYTIHEVQDDLREWLQKEFPDRTKFRYQTLTKTVPVHKDIGRTECINYIIDNGGQNVQTIWYEEDYVTPTHNVILPERTWHLLQVDYYHTVTNIQGRRFAITVQ